MSEPGIPMLTAELVESAMRQMWEHPVSIHVHIVAPRYRGWHLTRTGERVDATTECAGLCGDLVCLTRPEAGE